MLKYIDSLTFGSGPSSCMYSSCGSRRTPMGRNLCQGRGGAQVLHQGRDRRVRVQTAARGHDVHRPASDPAVLWTGDRLAVDGCPPAGESHERDDTWGQPLREPVEPRDARAVLVGAELGGAHGRSLDEVGEPDVVMTQRVPWVAIDCDETGGDGGRPEPVARSGEADAGIGRVEARVQSADQQTYVRPDDVGQRARS